ncbi:hypothetical protein ACWGJB_49020 [Streptomyces sp. NPDC054813]
MNAPDVKNGTAVPYKATKVAHSDPARAAASRTAAKLKKPVEWPTATDSVLPVAGTASTAKTALVGKLPVKVNVSGGTAPAKVKVRCLPLN